MRRRKKPGAKEKLLSHEEWICTEPELLKGQWAERFGNNHEIHVELGTGRGQFITNLAHINSHINYIAMEIKEEVLLKAVEKAKDKGLSNIVFLWYDVNKISEIFAEKELSRIYINFCDPWPKKRWEKRRLTHRGFLKNYERILKDAGEIHFKTDNEKLFEFSLNELAAMNYKLKNITFDLHKSEYTDNVTTEYEDKFAAQGIKIFRCEAGKGNSHRENI